MRERAPRKNNFSGLKILVTSAINVVPFYYLWYGAINDSVPSKNTNVEKINEYASERAWNFFEFSYKKTAISYIQGGPEITERSIQSIFRTLF